MAASKWPGHSCGPASLVDELVALDPDLPILPEEGGAEPAQGPAQTELGGGPVAGRRDHVRCEPVQGLPGSGTATAGSQAGGAVRPAIDRRPTPPRRDARRASRSSRGHRPPGRSERRRHRCSCPRGPGRRDRRRGRGRWRQREGTARAHGPTDLVRGPVRPRPGHCEDRPGGRPHSFAIRERGRGSVPCRWNPDRARSLPRAGHARSDQERVGDDVDESRTRVGERSGERLVELFESCHPEAPCAAEFGERGQVGVVE